MFKTSRLVAVLGMVALVGLWACSASGPNEASKVPATAASGTSDGKAKASDDNPACAVQDPKDWVLVTNFVKDDGAGRSLLEVNNTSDCPYWVGLATYHINQDADRSQDLVSQEFKLLGRQHYTFHVYLACGEFQDDPVVGLDAALPGPHPNYSLKNLLDIDKFGGNYGNRVCGTPREPDPPSPNPTPRPTPTPTPSPNPEDDPKVCFCHVTKASVDFTNSKQKEGVDLCLPMNGFVEGHGGIWLPTPHFPVPNTHQGGTHSKDHLGTCKNAD